MSIPIPEGSRFPKILLGGGWRFMKGPRNKPTPSLLIICLSFPFPSQTSSLMSLNIAEWHIAFGRWESSSVSWPTFQCRPTACKRMLLYEVADENILEAGYIGLIGTNYSKDLWCLLISDFFFFFIKKYSNEQFQVLLPSKILSSNLTMNQLGIMAWVLWGLRAPGGQTGLRGSPLTAFLPLTRTEAYATVWKPDVPDENSAW